jgi:hypothetical protein
LRKDQTTAGEVYEHSGNRNKIAQRFPSKREQRDYHGAKKRGEKSNPWQDGIHWITGLKISGC